MMTGKMQIINLMDPPCNKSGKKGTLKEENIRLQSLLYNAEVNQGNRERIEKQCAEVEARRQAKKAKKMPLGHAFLFGMGCAILGNMLGGPQQEW